MTTTRAEPTSAPPSSSSWRLARQWNTSYPVFLVVAASMLTLMAVGGHPPTAALGFAVLQYTASIGPVALAFGLVMLAGQFDLSVSSVFVVAGIIAVKTGNSSWVLGLMCAIAFAVIVGIVQGLLVGRLGAPSLPVTLGGLITLGGLAYVMTGSQSIAYDDYEIGIRLQEPIATFFSIQSLVALACFAVAHVVLRYARPGRDTYAVGGNASAARSAGIKVALITTTVFAVSAALAALSGALVAFTLASASPVNASDPLIPAAIGAVVGGVGVRGGTGSPLGVLAGVLTLGIIQAAFNVLAAPEYVTKLVYGALLIGALIAATDGQSAWRAFVARRSSWAPTVRDQDSRVRRPDSPS
ncbi:hypothetical protein JCM18899A_50600 [Nocardioides sp. AN3]